MAVAALGITVFMTATGGLGRVVAAIGQTFSGVLDDLTATPTPRPTVAVVADSPLIAAPDEPYTNQRAIDLVVGVPGDVVGQADAVVRLYLALPEQAPAPILEVQMSTTPQVIIPNVALEKGRNDFTATIVGPAGESEPSPVVTFFLDLVLPKVELSAPREGQTINRPTVTLKGKTQGRSTIVGRNEANGASGTTSSGSDGLFELSMPIAGGNNAITLTITDPAGNVGEHLLTVRRGNGKLTAGLSSDPFRIRVSRLPGPLDLAVVVDDPDGRPLEGARVTFTLSIPGIPRCHGRVDDRRRRAGGVPNDRSRRVPPWARASRRSSSTTDEFGQTTTAR